MKKIGVWIWGCLLGGMVAACGGGNGTHGEEPDFTGLDSLIQGWVDKGYYPGAAICVKQDTAVLFRKSYGAVSPDTPVYVASAGKWVAAAVVAAVVDRTELSWDDPVEKWLPEFKGDPKGVIPLRRLLSHTSGIRPYLPEPRVDNYNHLDSAVAEILPLDTVFTPGTRFEYGGLAMQVAGRMAEVAAGKEFETLFQELLAGPLRMTRSHFTPVNTDGGHAPMLGGGLCTTLNDYMNFLDMIIHGGVFEGQRILREATVKEMQADQVGRAKVAGGEYVERALGRHHQGVYGLGEWREMVGDDAFAWHLVFQPQTCYYLLRNAKSGKYFTFKSGSIKTAEVAEPGEQESFHLMRGRVPVILGVGNQTLNTKGYWICEGKRNMETPPALQAETDGNTKTASTQDFSNAATSQRWIILTADQIRLVDESKVTLNREKLRRYVIGAKEMVKIPHHDATDDATGIFTALTNRMESSVDNLATVQDLENAIWEMYTGIISFMSNTVLDNLSAYDLSFLVDNSGMETLDGWDCSQADVLLFTNGLCNTSSTFDLYQTLKQMPKGVYRAGVQGFERPGTYSQVGKDYVSGINNVSTSIYLYNRSSKIHNIMVGGQEKKLGTSSQVYTQGLYIPNNVASASDYMEEQLYDNTLVVEVKRDAEDIKLGLKNTKAVSSDWVVFDNFSLSYYGSNVSVDDVTGINDVKVDTTVVERQGVYDLSGRAIANPTRPGIYIVNGKKIVIH